MKTETLTTITAIIQADESCEAGHRERILRACRTKPDKRRLGTVRQAAAILDCHPRTVQRYARRGMLHPIKITCRRVRFDLAEVERLATEGAAT